MSHVEALQSTDITKIGIGVIVALVVLGALISLVVTAIIGRLIILVVVVALGIFVWAERSSVQSKVDDFKNGQVASCQFDKTFFGIHVKAPASLVAECKMHLK
jgi:protein-S-isoprenylcysteine O-methyltransferase Ste14